jgi:hypothetical protein
MSKHTRKQEREAQRRAWALGIFVQEFEHMVDRVRGVILGCTGCTPFSGDQIVMVILTHQALGASALFEIMRGAIGEKWRYLTFPDDRRERLSEIITQIGKEYSDLCKLRNNLLHGTWLVQPTDLSLAIYKWRAKLDDGLRPIDKIPTAAKEFVALARCCRLQAKMISAVSGTIQSEYNPKYYFSRRGKLWVTSWPDAVPD